MTSCIMRGSTLFAARLKGATGAVPCSPSIIPTDLVKPNCIPSGLLAPKGWDIVVDYYKHGREVER